MLKKSISALLILAMAFALIAAPPAYMNAADSTSSDGAPSPMSNFVTSSTYESGQFPDIDEDQWYGYNHQKPIARAVEYGLMRGNEDGTFAPMGNVTLAQAITIAARVHSIYTTGSENFNQGLPWYQVYVNYAIVNGIIFANDFDDYDRNATRAEMAFIFSHSLPPSELGELNDITSLPDVTAGTPYQAAIFLLYRAGVLTGSDSLGTFYPSNDVSRAEAAAIISRVILPNTRAGAPDSGDGNSSEIVSIRVVSGSLLMAVGGGTCTLAADSADEGAKFTWASSDLGVATVDSSGVVTAVGVGDAVITATTENGQEGGLPIKVMPSITAITYFTEKQTSGTVSYDMKVGTNVPMFLPQITPADACNTLTYTSSNPNIAKIVENEDETYSIEGLSAGSSTITATGHNGMSHSFVINVQVPLTNATIPATRTMNVCDYWDIPVTLTPATNAYGNFMLESSDPSVVRIEQNTKAYSVGPGTATITASIDGVVKSSCAVTVNRPAPAISGNPGLLYYNVTYESDGYATVELGIVPVNGVDGYVITEHKAFTAGMTPTQLFDDSNIYDQWAVAQDGYDETVSISGTQTGLRFFSIFAGVFDDDDKFHNVGDTFLLRVPVLYYPRNIGGTSEQASDGFVLPTQHLYMMYKVVPFSWGYFDPYPIPIEPFAIYLTFDPVPGASGYDFFATWNGEDAGSITGLQPSTARAVFDTGMVWNNGTIVIYVLPFVFDIDGTTKLYGDMRTVVFNIDIYSQTIFEYGLPNFFWENSASLNSPVITIDMY